MGGEGGGVLADWIIDLAESNHYIAQLTSVPGVAQRTGATIYYLEIYPRAGIADAAHEPVLALMPVPGDVDIVIASELMEAGRAIQRGLITPDRTTLIASTNRVFSMTEKVAMADGRVDAEKLIEACRSAARTMHAFDMAAIAEATGSVISAVLFGALAGAGVLPFPRQAFEGAIKRGGVGIKASLAAFTAGFEATTSGVATVKTPAATMPPPTLDGQDSDETPTKAPPHKPIPAELLAREREISAPRARDHPRRDRAHGGLSGPRLRAALSRSPRADRARPTSDGRLIAETARQLALGMAYEDTIRVAELKIRPSRFERVREEVRVNDDQILEIAEFMHPRTQEIADTLPAPLGRFILQHRLGARPDRPHDAQGPRGEDELAARLPAALHGGGVQAAAPALAALPGRERASGGLARDRAARRRDALRSRGRGRGRAQSGEGLRRHPRARPRALRHADGRCCRRCRSAPTAPRSSRACARPRMRTTPARRSMRRSRR